MLDCIPRSARVSRSTTICRWLTVRGIYLLAVFNGTYLTSTTWAENVEKLDDKPPAVSPDTAPSKPIDVAATDQKTVEQLAESARKSVVVIHVEGRDGNRQGLGSGFVISDKGLIATNQHVISEGRALSVQFSDGKTAPVTAIHATQRASDLAIIQVDRTDLAPLPLGDAEQLKLGQTVVSLGNPHGLKHSVVAGVVSGKRVIDGREMIQLAMPIEPGNSGGPVLDLQGRVQGVVTMKSLVTNNLGFAVTINALQPLLDQPNPIQMEKWLTIGAIDARNWTQLFGARWRQRAGRITVEGQGKGFGGRALCLSTDTPPEPPYDIRVQVRLKDEGGAAGLVFHSDGADRHYGFYPSNRKLRVSRFDGPDVFAWNVLQEKPHPAYQPGEWNTLRVRVEPQRFLCYVNESLVLESVDGQLPAGKIGLAKFRETEAEFKNFAMGRDLPVLTPPAEVVERVTSLVDDLPVNQAPADKLLTELLQESGSEITVLRNRARLLELQAAQLRKLAGMVHQKRTRQKLVDLLSQPEAEINLAHAALLVAQLDNDELDVPGYLADLDQLANDLNSRVPPDATPTAKRELLNKFLFEEHGFHGSRGDYYNKSNSYLNEVLDDREGLPITLAVVYLELGRRMGLDLVGIGLPSHFVVEQLPAESPRVFIDVYDAGAVLTTDAAAALVFQNTDQHLKPEQLAVVSKKAIVQRILGNLMGLARDSEDGHAMLGYVETLVALNPDGAEQRWFQAVLRYQVGQLQAAQADVNWLLERAPEGLDLVRVRELGNVIQRQLDEQALLTTPPPGQP